MSNFTENYQNNRFTITIFNTIDAMEKNEIS